MDFITDTSVEINGTNLHYKLTGSGKITLVFLHAGVADSRLWKQQVDYFAKHFQVLIYDLRGFGQTALPSGEYSHAADLYALLRHLGIGEVILIGMSMGGAAAINFALTYPNMVSALVLVGSAVNGHSLADEHLEVLWEAASEAFMAGDEKLAAHIEMETWLVGPNRDPEDIPEHLKDLVQTMILRSYDLENDEAEEQDDSAVEKLDHITVPTLIIVGQEDVAAIRNLAVILDERIPNSRKIIMSGAAHLPNLEKPVEFNRLIHDFLLARL